MCGLNEITSESDESLFKKLIGTCIQDILILLLIAVVSAIMNNFNDAICIILTVVIVVTVGFGQKYKSGTFLEALNKFVPLECCNQ